MKSEQTKGERGEEKEAFFGVYHGQDICYWTNGDVTDKVDPKHFYDHDNYLLLKPLHAITDEDAIEFFDILWAKDETHKNKPREFKIDFGKDWALAPTSERYGLIPTGLFHGVDFLRSKGYALNFRDISVSEQTELGWIKLIE